VTPAGAAEPPDTAASLGIIGAQDVMNAQTLPQVQMPNREHFILAYPTPR